MPTVIGHHDVKDTEHWLASPKREEVFAPLGVTNIRGELLVCVSPGRLLGVDSPEPAAVRPSIRLIVLQANGVRAVMPVEEVSGIRKFQPRDLADVPATVSKATTSHSNAVVSCDSRVIGLLDDEALFRTLTRSLR